MSFSRLSAALAATALLLMPALSSRAEAQDHSLTASYAVTVAGLRIGTGWLSVAFRGDGYAATVRAQTTSVGRLVSAGQGEATARGRLRSTRPVPVSYDLSASEEDKTNVVEMQLSGGNITRVTAEPPLTPHPHRVAVERQHRRGIVDPVSALLIPVPNAEAANGPAACNRALPIFDGRQRYDIELTFVRMDRHPLGQGGQAVVCRARYVPIAGHRSSRRVNQELSRNQDLFVWLAQVGDRPLVAPVRMEVGLNFGRVIIDARSFEYR
ncbi:MAG: DUF3108 domain-containing protein [Hyphomicrobiaceae bacterium]|nr:DUF3108 domain-containing protein [Hyphomicrobiaceae bacterium]